MLFQQTKELSESYYPIKTLKGLRGVSPGGAWCVVSEGSSSGNLLSQILDPPLVVHDHCTAMMM